VSGARWPQERNSADPPLHRTRPSDLFPVAPRLLLPHTRVAAGPVSFIVRRGEAQWVATTSQERWMRLIELMNSDEFGYPCSWFEDANAKQLLLMANRTIAAQYVPADAQRMRVDGETWVRDEWIYEDIQSIYRRLQEYPEYLAQIRDGAIYIELTPEGRA
jgi:hypothetical protein